MQCIGINSEPSRRIAFFKGIDHFLGAAQWNGRILGAMESPDGHVCQQASVTDLAAAADRHNGCEAFWCVGRQRPRPKPSHAQAGDIHTIAIDLVPCHDIVEQRRELHNLGRPRPVRWTLRANDNKRKGLSRRDQLRGPVPLDLRQVRPLSPAPCRKSSRGQGPFCSYPSGR